MKTKEEVRELVAKGETHNVEFKAKYEANKVGQAICALANDWPLTGSGTLIIGIHDKTQAIIGILDDFDEVQQNIANICRTAMSPALAPVVYVVELDMPIIAVDITVSKELPCRYKNDCYIRIGTTTRSANFIEELTLHKRTKTGGNVRRIEGKLPPRDQPTDFVGRGEELAQLWQWMKNPRSFRCTLAGDGGKGKTAIAYEFAMRIVDASLTPYELVLWASAKRKQFVDGKITPISLPGFRDLSSLLDKLLNDIGFPEDQVLPLEKKEEKVLELLTKFPALVVIDDLDSIDWSSDVATMEFITYTLPHIEVKVLITTRRQIPSIPNIFVEGFEEDDGGKFIESRIHLAGMSLDILNKNDKRRILKATDSSPLYMEDLLRLFVTIGDLDEVIHQWSLRSGEEARTYALKRELEMLSNDARLALLSFSVFDQPATSVEAKAVAGLTWAKWQDAVSDLQRLFLIPRPGIVEGIPRFTLNSNTKALVLQVMETNSELLRLRQNVRAVSGGSYRDTAKRKSVGAYITQASAFIKIGDCKTAEKTIKAGLDEMGEDPDLVGALGWVYKCFTPPRMEDARGQFRRAAELKCNNSEMYGHWYEMEEHIENWPDAAEAGRTALIVFPRNYLWTFRLGYTLSRYGQLLVRQLQPRGRIYLARANKIIGRLLERLEASIHIDFDLHKKVWRAYVINNASLYNSAPDEEKKKYNRLLASAIKEWIAQYGNDPAVDYESQNLLNRYPEIKAMI